MSKMAVKMCCWAAEGKRSGWTQPARRDHLETVRRVSVYLDLARGQYLGEDPVEGAGLLDQGQHVRRRRLGNVGRIVALVYDTHE